ncbi:MAG: hypothetical protein ABUK08_03180 [Candidatus Humimicrobiaceae bacterium]
MVETKDKSIIRDLAKEWMEIANLPVMDERKRLWKKINDLNPDRPMILVETDFLFESGKYILDTKILCEDEYLRNIEKTLRWIIKHFYEVGDDFVVEPYFRLAWQFSESDYGVPLTEYHAEDSKGEDLGYSYNFPIKTPKDLEKLKIRTRTVDKEKTLSFKSQLEDIMGDILPVKLANWDPFHSTLGYTPWVGNNFIGVAMYIFKMLGNENMLLWLYDSPDSIHKIAKYMMEDRIVRFNWLEKEGYLGHNTDNQMAGPRSYGYVSDLPEPSDSLAKINETWGWADSQETTMISPKMFDEFFLPYIAEVSKMFGLIYYGCCEPIDDRWKLIEKAIPNIRKVSISGWSDFYKMGEMLGEKYVYSRKPIPAYISYDSANWDLIEKDLDETIKATQKNNCILELLFRDIYTVNNDNSRLGKWVDLAKSKLGI